MNGKLKYDMKKILTALALSIISGLLLAQKSIVQTDQNTTVKVRITSGILRGIEQDGIVSFKGIPYDVLPAINQLIKPYIKLINKFNKYI